MGFVTCLFLVSCPLVITQNPVRNGINESSSRLIVNIESSNPDSNFILSPLSLHSSFSQLLTGAGGRTQAEVEAALGVRKSDGLVSQYAQLSSSNQALKTANILALNKWFTPYKSFVQKLKDGFGSKVKTYDMVNKKGRVVAEINSIVSTQTNRKIRDLLSPEDLTPSTKMILINAVYFKANWKTAFNPQDSFDADFQTLSLGKVMTRYMTADMDAKLDETKDLDILELPYEDGKTSMIFFLPKNGRTSRNIMNSVAKYSLNSLRSIRPSNAAIIIPKFKMTYKTALKQEMMSLGMRDLFTDNANFTFISSQPLQVSDGIHKAFIDVNEEGTEAAAATAVLFSTRSGGSSKKVFFANRPFMFMVYDSVNNIPVFMGKISNPAKKNENRKISSATKPTKSAKVPKSLELINPIQGNRIKDCNTIKETIGAAVQKVNECNDQQNSFQSFPKYQAKLFGKPRYF
eukprot:TRINITY_DN8304_c0_g1_i3.p1 TRINITY_DN8304_c0_g1~~TRINITY_DN8304_c0_g1_i3.p1  ORF type:complete len:461 (-),score=110.69 TRINITY_DN8304_c0_g1_i3:108-1490(-)